MNCSLKKLRALLPLRPLFFSLGLFLVSPSLGRAESPVDAQGKVVNFGRDIAPIFVAKCLKCHGPEEAKNDFRVDVRDNVLSYVTPEDVAGSSLWSDYLATADEEMLMPPVAKGGPLSPGELALLRTWIQEGAIWPESVVLDPTEPSEKGASQTKPETPLSLPGRLWAFQGYMHPATVHFPVALLCVGALFVIAGYFRPSLNGGDVAYYCLLLGAVSAVFAAMMGWSFAYEQGYGDWTKTDNGNLTRHRWFGVAVAAVAVGFACVALKARNARGSKLDRVWKAGLIVTAMLVSIVGHQGGELTYHELYENAFKRLWNTSEVVAPPIDEVTK